MSEENQPPEEEKGLSHVQKLMIGIGGIIIVGYFMVGSNKEQTPEQMEAAAMIRIYAAIQDMANEKCPVAIKQKTGEQVYFPSDTKSDRDTYITLTWKGESGKFKTAECTLTPLQGGISKLIIDDEVVIDKSK